LLKYQLKDSYTVQIANILQVSISVTNEKHCAQLRKGFGWNKPEDKLPECKFFLFQYARNITLKQYSIANIIADTK